MNYTLRLALDWFVIVTALVLADWLGPWSWWPALMVIGSRQHAIGEIMHMAMHRRRPFLYKLTARILGIDPDEYERFHWAHHRHLGDPDLDPEIAMYAKWPERWTTPRRRDLVLDALGLHAGEAILTVNRISTPRSMAPQAIVVAALAFVWPIVLLWPASVVTGLMLCHRLRARTEHRPLTEPGITIKQQEPTRWERFAQHLRGNRDWDHWGHHNPGARRKEPKQ